MAAGFVHGLSLVVVQMMTVVTAFMMSWSASQKLEGELTVQATIDPLTQIYNRRALLHLVLNAISRAIRNNSLVALILIDIDHFKRVNDSHGHQTGDEVLVAFAKRLQDNLRKHDLLARYGGEEFMVLLPESDAEEALTIAEKLRQ